MARYSNSARRPVLSAARVLIALFAAFGVIIALLYSSYLGYTALLPPDVEVDPGLSVDTDPTSRQVRYGSSWLERSGNLWVMRLQGTPEQIGAAQGHLTSRLFSELSIDLRRYLEQRIGSGLESWAGTMSVRWEYRDADASMPPERRRELAALAQALPESVTDGVFDPYQLIFLHQCFLGLSQRLEDSTIRGSMFAYAPRRGTERGNLVVGRNLELDLERTVAPARIISFVIPDGKYPFVSVGWPGLIGVVSGINARGIWVSVNPARTDDPVSEGMPLPLALRQVLEQADTLDQAIEILMKAPIRTAGSVMIGDGVGRNAAVVELAPRGEDRRVVRGQKDALVFATDHLTSEVFDREAHNDWLRRYTSSGYRYDRLAQLLRARSELSPKLAASVLRDRSGIDNVELGLGNRNALDDLRLLQSVVVDATSMMMWVAEEPSNLGAFRAFDLAHELGRANTPPAPLLDFPSDPVLYGEPYKDYLQAVSELEHARKLLVLGDLEAARSSVNVGLGLAPSFGELHRLQGDIERELGNTDQARRAYRRYLELTPGRLRDQERVRGILTELGDAAGQVGNMPAPTSDAAQ